jgi:hypothetical protein
MSAALAEFVPVDADVAPPTSNQDQWRSATDTDGALNISAGSVAAILYPLSRLGSMELSRPIIVTVESDDDSVIMNSPALRLWGTGADVYEALADFTTTFLDILQSYQAGNSDTLSDGALQYRAQLEAYLR